jgi:hypothetical protein
MNITDMIERLNVAKIVLDGLCQENHADPDTEIEAAYESVRDVVEYLESIKPLCPAYSSPCVPCVLADELNQLRNDALRTAEAEETAASLRSELESLRSSYAGVTASIQTLYHTNDDLIKESTSLRNKVDRLDILIDGISLMCVQNTDGKTLADRVIERIRLHHQRDNQI